MVILSVPKSLSRARRGNLFVAQQSWEVTIGLTTELRQRGAVPEGYARLTLDAARQELEKTRQTAEHLTR
jgi:hypothetical protein